MTMTTESEVADLRRRLNAAHATAAYHKKQSAARFSEIRRLKAEQKDGHRIGYEDGARATTLLSYLALADYGLDGIGWFTDRVSAVLAKRKPPLSSYAVDKAVTADVIRHMSKYNPKRAAEVEKSFADFLAGGTP
jgi:hypothetical protein